MGFNALKYVEELEKSGVPEGQAKAQVRLLHEIVESNLATKQDVESLRIEFKRDIKELELRLKNDLTLRMGSRLFVGIVIVATLVKLF